MRALLATLALLLAGCLGDDGGLATGAKPFVRVTFWNNATEAVSFEFSGADVTIGPQRVGAGDRVSAAADYQPASFPAVAKAGGDEQPGRVEATAHVVHVLVEWDGTLRVRVAGGQWV